MTSVDFVELSSDELRADSRRLAELVESDGYCPDCVSYLARGGLIIGEEVASFFDAPLVELSSHRSGDKVKSRVTVILCRLPRWLKKALRKREMSRRFASDRGTAQETSLEVTGRYEIPPKASRILLVDDSADTGSSIGAARSLLRKLFPYATVHVAVINAFHRAIEGGNVDWWIREDTLLCTPSSKDSKEYRDFIKKYYESEWIGNREETSRTGRSI